MHNSLKTYAAINIARNTPVYAIKGHLAMLFGKNETQNIVSPVVMVIRSKASTKTELRSSMILPSRCNREKWRWENKALKISISFRRNVRNVIVKMNNNRQNISVIQLFGRVTASHWN